MKVPLVPVPVVQVPAPLVFVHDVAKVDCHSRVTLFPYGTGLGDALIVTVGGAGRTG